MAVTITIGALGGPGPGAGGDLVTTGTDAGAVAIVGLDCHDPSP